MKNILITTEKCSKECLGEGFFLNGSLILSLVFYYSDLVFIQSFETELLSLGLFTTTFGLLLKLWFRTRNILDITSGVLLTVYGNLFYSKKNVVLELSNVRALQVKVSSYFSSLSTRHIKLKLIALDDSNISYCLGEGSDKFWLLLYRCILISKNFEIPLQCDPELNEYLKRIKHPTIDNSESESTYKTKARIELVTDFFIWFGVASVPCVIAIGLLIMVGPRIS